MTAITRPAMMFGTAAGACRALLGLLLALPCLVDCHHEARGITVHAGDVAARPGDPPLPVLDWSDPADPIHDFSIEPSGPSLGPTWSCTSPNGERLAPPLRWGITPKTTSGARWSCLGSIELFADETYNVTANAGNPGSWSGTFSGIAAVPPPDTILESSFEDGLCQLTCPAESGGACDPNVADFASTADAHTGSKACRICSTKAGTIYLGLALATTGRGHHVLEAWVHADRASPADAPPEDLFTEFRYPCGPGCVESPTTGSLSINEDHMVLVQQVPGPIASTYAQTHLTLDLPKDVAVAGPNRFAMRVGARAPSSGACLVIDDVRVVRE